MSDIRDIWKNQDREDAVITLTDIQGRSGKFRGRIRWRNLLIGGYSLYASGILVYALLRVPPNPELFAIVRPGVILTLLAHLWILFALWWRGRTRPLPDTLAGEAALDFHRRELEHQRQAASTAWAWYILPFAPASAFLIWLLATRKLPNMTGPTASLAGVLMVFFFLAIWLAFSRSAARHELELERLKRLRAE
jgi:hypothetical protein